MYCDAYLLMAALTLWIPSRKFGSSLPISDDDDEVLTDASEKSKGSLWSSIERDFGLLKQLTALINNVFGIIVILFLLEALLTYGSITENLILQQKNPDWKRVALNVLYYFQCHCIILFSADICHQVCTLHKSYVNGAFTFENFILQEVIFS